MYVCEMYAFYYAACWIWLLLTDTIECQSRWWAREIFFAKYFVFQIISHERWTLRKVNCNKVLNFNKRVLELQSTLLVGFLFLLRHFVTQTQRIYSQKFTFYKSIIYGKFVMCVLFDYHKKLLWHLNRESKDFDFDDFQ